MPDGQICGSCYYCHPINHEVIGAIRRIHDTRDRIGSKWIGLCARHFITEVTQRHRWREYVELDSRAQALLDILRIMEM